jgi:hypothetical protein
MKTTPARGIIARLWAATPGLTGPERLQAFELLPPSMQLRAWTEIARAAREAWR